MHADTPASPGASRPLRCTVHGSDEALAQAAPLLAVLAALLPLRFDDGSQKLGDCRSDGDDRRTVLRLLLRAPGRHGLRLVDDRVPSLSVAADLPAGDARLRPATVAFAVDPRVPWPLRGRSLALRVADAPPLAAPDGGETVLAHGDGAPLWAVHTRAGVAHHRCALPLPALAEGHGFADVFHGERFAELLPLLHLLRTLTGEAAWQSPRLRACFMVDDPNLHWPRYGHVDYGALAAHAARHRYHAAFATVPVDSWFTHRATASLLRRHQGRLSLTVHGNEHARDELAQQRPASQRQALLQQALQRIARLEWASGLHVSRVMVPPHGACSAAMLASLAQAGFDAACVSTGSLRHHNPGQPWTRTAGYRLSECIGGCPVLPRWGLGGAPRNALLLAAYLGQALVLRVHQQDLRHGLDLFAEIAGLVNGLAPAAEPVHWGDMASLARLDWQWRIADGVLHLRPFGRRCRIEPPPVAALCIEPPDDAADLPRLPGDAGWRCGVGAAAFTLGPHTLHALPQPAPALTLERSTLLAAPPLPLPVAARPVPPLRRLLAEARDRLSVLLPAGAPPPVPFADGPAVPPSWRP